MITANGILRTFAQHPMIAGRSTCPPSWGRKSRSRGDLSRTRA